jgi:hypothetical protein
MRYVKQELLTLMNYQQVPFERMVADGGLGGQNRNAGPYQSMFSFQDARERARHLGSLQTRQMHLMQRGATDDIGVWLMDKPHGLEGALIYNADIYLRETGAQLRDRYLELLHRAADRPAATLAYLATDEGSASAAYLRKLAAGEPEAREAPNVARRPCALPPNAIAAGARRRRKACSCRSRRRSRRSGPACWASTSTRFARATTSSTWAATR